MESDAEKERRLVQECREILQTVEAERRPDLNRAEEIRYDALWAELKELRGEAASMTSLSGDGWRVSSSPRWRHRDLQTLADEVQRSVFPWGTVHRWQWRWGVLDGPFADYAAVTLYQHKLVVVDERKLAQRSDRDVDLLETLLEELTTPRGLRVFP
jgi:hypothetical protein